jgi:hypothetical protein
VRSDSLDRPRYSIFHFYVGDGLQPVARPA